jgi:hypothetical protein
MEKVLQNGTVMMLATDSFDEILDRQPEEQCEVVTMSLSATLLAVTAEGLSFATPGHRCGRSFGLIQKMRRRVR